MNRREAFKAVSVLPLLPVLATGAGTTEIRYKDTEWKVWTEELSHQTVEYAVIQDGPWAAHKVRAIWRSDESPRVTYALGFLVSDEDVADLGYSAAIHGEKMKKLRIAMRNRIRYTHHGWPVLHQPYVPVKPEGMPFIFMD